MTAAELQHVAETRRLPVGCRVTVPGLPGVYTVADQDDAATIALRSAHGATVRVGRLAIELRGESDE